MTSDDACCRALSCWRGTEWRTSLAICVVVGSLFPLQDARAQLLPSNFVETTIIDGLSEPTAVRFSPDGRIFVAEKAGRLKVFNGEEDSVGQLVADLTQEVYAYWDRGFLGLALHPNFPVIPYVYVLYTYDAPPGEVAPVYNDSCADATGVGCVVTSRLSRLHIDSSNQWVGHEDVLLHGSWCQQYPSHTTGDLAFAPDGALLVSAGDGASFTFVDYGQMGSPPNPCEEPIGYGGALRSQGPLTRGSQATFDGAIIRVNPDTGEPLPDNPLYTNGTSGLDAIVAYGLRNPYRMAFRPGTSELWVGEVGWQFWEEINVVKDPTDQIVENFGWPCLEGPGLPTSGYQNLSFCTDLFAGAYPSAQLTDPFYTYWHGDPPNPEHCALGGNSITGIAFYNGGNYPAEYHGGLVFADYSANCIWVMLPDDTGYPNPANIVTLVAYASQPVMVEIGPQGDVFYVDHSRLGSGSVKRIQYLGANHPPLAKVHASVTDGEVPLTVILSAAESFDASGGALSYAWDLNGNGSFQDAHSVVVEHTFYNPGTYKVGLQVTNENGASSSAHVFINASNTPPLPLIVEPLAVRQWAVGDVIAFSGVALDAQDGVLSKSALRWGAVLHHCPSDCHAHALEIFEGVSSGRIVAPDHSYPSYLEIYLEATDSFGLSARRSVYLWPRVIDLTVQSHPSGLTVHMGPFSNETPFIETVIVGSRNSLSAPTPQMHGDEQLHFQSWEEYESRSVDFVAPEADVFLTAYFDVDPPNDDGGGGDDNCPGVDNPDQSDRDADGVGDACDACPDIPGLVALAGCPDCGSADMSVPRISEYCETPQMEDSRGCNSQANPSNSFVPLVFGWGVFIILTCRHRRRS